MLIKKIIDCLKSREFVSVATCDFDGKPNAAPKLILKLDNSFVYLIDYAIGRTWINLQSNPRVSLSFTDTDTLNGYQLNGKVELIKSGPVYNQMLEELHQKKIDLVTKRVIEGILRGKKHENFELAIPDKFVIFKIHIEEVVEIGLQGQISREKVC